jgi:hypothetical protein
MLSAGISALVQAAKMQDYDQIADKIKQLVPEYIRGNNA